MNAFLGPLIDRLDNVPSAVGLFVCFLLLSNVFQLAIPGGQLSLDRRPFYRPSAVYPALASYSEEDRRMYAARELTLDIAYPIVYALMGAVVLTLLLGGLSESHPRIYSLRWLPFWMAGFDVLENLGIATMALAYGEGRRELPGLPTATAIASAGKWIFAFLSLLFLLFGLVVALQRLASRLTSPS